MNPLWHFLACGMVICLVWTVPCRAAESLAGLRACRDIADAAARLACFDREAAALDASLRTSAATSPTAPRVAATPTPTTPAAAPSAPPAAAPPAHAAAALDPQQQFGLPERAVVAKEVAAGTRAADATKIEAHLARIAPAPDGRVVFTLDNDQVWRQLTLEGDLLAKQGDVVTISRGWLGSYWLQIKSGRGCKVTRLR